MVNIIHVELLKEMVNDTKESNNVSDIDVVYTSPILEG